MLTFPDEEECLFDFVAGLQVADELTERNVDRT
jgi:hypothetical protein